MWSKHKKINICTSLQSATLHKIDELQIFQFFDDEEWVKTLFFHKTAVLRGAI